MSTHATKAADNIYYKCRMEAAKHDSRLYSREGASELLGVSVSTLANYELGLRLVPTDIIIKMADLYCAPEIRNDYCRNYCPLGAEIPKVDIESLDRITIKALSALKKVQGTKEDLLDITEDGFISDEEKPTLNRIMQELDEVVKVAHNLKLWVEKNNKGGET